MNVVHIWPEQPVRREGSLVVSAAIEKPGRERIVLWYSVPEGYETSLTPSADPFVVGSIYLLMQLGHDVKVHGMVSPSLLRNLDEFHPLETR